MHIGIDASRAARTQPTGTEAYSFHLIRALLETLRNHQIILYSPTPLPGSIGEVSLERGLETSHSGASVRIIPFPRLWTHLRLNWELRRHPPDLLFVPAHVMPLACPVPAVVTVHDLGYLYYPEAHRLFDRYYLDWTTRRHAHKAARLIADSQATRADLVRHYRADPQRVVVIYPGRDETLQRVQDAGAMAAVKARYGVQGRYLLYLGTLQPRKNLARLIEAFARVRALLPGQEASSSIGEGSQESGPLQLVLAGKRGWLYDDLFQRVDQLGLVGQVIFPGYVAPEDKAALISGALALVHPSLYEGFGMPVLEAMACGTPVLTSRASSLPEVTGDAALLVDPLDVEDIASGLLRLVTDDGLRRWLVERGYTQVHRFSWRQAASQLWEVFDSLPEGTQTCGR
jgi:glycosyltransferase involved in cell wall biosynthesis